MASARSSAWPRDRWGQSRALAVRFDLTGVRDWGTYLGGDGIDTAASIVATATGIVAIGATASTDIATPNAHQPDRAGGDDAMVALDASGARECSTHDGGTGEAACADALRGWLSSQTSVSRPMADACADTAMMKLDDIAAVYAVIEYRTFNSPTVEADEYKGLLTTSPSIGEVWDVTLWRPISYEINLPPLQYYRLARRPYALVIRGEVGGIVDLANNQVVCSGLLPESAAASRDGRKAGVDFMLRPLRAICARVEGDTCALVKPRW